MKSHVRVAVIGGGVVGCSVLYHLTKAGWSEVALFERDELTCGSTWHAAGGMHTLNSDPNVAKLQQYTIGLYKEIEEVSGQSCGIHLPGGIMLASDKDWLDYLKVAQAKGKVLGLDQQFISVREAKDLHPLIDEKHFVGALFDPFEGHVDPSGVTNAYAKAARKGGAEIYRHTRVMELVPQADGSWDVVTEKGTVRAEIVVNAGGLWAREVGRMAGLELPLLAMEHHYLITDEVPELKGRDRELVHTIDFGGEIYMRQEHGGVLLGTYERGGKPWSERVTPWDFGHELLQPDLERIADNLEVAFEHFPALANVGIKQAINGPFVFTPDGNPLVGPVRGLRNFHLACGVMAGFSQGGGVGLALANWITAGDPGFDVWAMDCARFGEWAGMSYTNAKVRENYARRFRLTFPNEQLPAARPLRTTSLYDRQTHANAVWGVSFGLEQPQWFAPGGTSPEEDVTFRRSNAFGPIGEECRAVRKCVGMMEISGFAKYEITGPGAEGWLSHMLANRMPREGRLTLTPMLNERGRLIGDFTVAKAGPELFYMFGSGPAETYHMRWFEGHLPAGEPVRVRALGSTLVGLSIAGPHARELLARLTGEDVSNEALPFLSVRTMELGMVPAMVARISFTGDLGYELWVEPDYLTALFDLLMTEGSDLGLSLFGGRALDSLRLEKSWGTWAREYRPIYTPWDAGLGRFVDEAKNDFIGRDAALRARDNGAPLRLTAFVVDADGADVWGDEPIFHGGQIAGWVTSGGYAHFSERSVAMGYVKPAFQEAAEGFEIEILGEPRAARVQPTPLFDPQAARMRG